MNQNLVKNGNYFEKKGIITKCLEKVLYTENLLFRVARVNDFLEEDERCDSMYEFSVYFSGENIDTIRVELLPIEEEELIVMKCCIPNIIPNGCNEDALRKECDKLNFLYGEHVTFSFYANDGCDDARIYIEYEREIEEEDPTAERVQLVTTPEALADIALDDARELAKIVDHAFLGLVYAAWKAD